MSIVTPPRAGIVLGFAKVDGKDVPVTISDEYLRWFAGLMDRVGGIKSIDLDELAALVVSPVAVHPQDQTPTPALSMDEVIQRAEDAARQQVLALMSEMPQPTDHAGEIASLREENGMGQKINRIVPGTITISAGNLTGTYNITPGVNGPCELRFLGAKSDDVDCDGANAYIQRAGSVITAYRNTTGFTTEVAFEFTEYFP